MLPILFSCLRVNAEFEVTEKLTSVNKVVGTTADGNILQEVEKTLIWDKLKWNLLRCAATNGSKNRFEEEKCLVGQICKACINVRCLKLKLFIVFFISNYFEENI